MSIFEKNIIVRCESCFTNNVIDINEIDVEALSGGERAMGEETIWEWEYQLNCKNCGQEIKMSDSVSEYPIGVYNFPNPQIVGAIYAEPPSYKFS